MKGTWEQLVYFLWSGGYTHISLEAMFGIEEAQLVECTYVNQSLDKWKCVTGRTIDPSNDWLQTTSPFTTHF